VIRLSRRSFMYGSCALIGASSAALRGFNSASEVLRAKDFLESVGIATHPCWRNTIWGSSDWASRLVEAGVKNARGEIAHGASARAALPDLHALFAAGVKMCALISDPTLDRGRALADVQFLADYVGAENVCGIEGPNEINNPRTRSPDWAPRLREFERWLHDTVRSSPHLSSVPIVAPSMWENVERDCIALGNLEPNIDRGCIHYYTGGRRPSRAAVSGGGDVSMFDALRTARITAPHKPLYATEFGFNVAAGSRGLSPWVITQRAAAKYLMRGLLELFANGVQKTFIYSLLDDAKANEHYGLLDERLNPRMSFRALRNMMQLFVDEGDPPLTTQPLELNIEAHDPRLRQLLFRKSNSFLLCMYLDVDSYDRRGLQDVNVAPSSVVLTLPQAAARIRVFTPLSSGTPSAILSDVRSATIPVSDDVKVVEIVPREGGSAHSKSRPEDIPRGRISAN
jgi:hypothetical protein